MINDGKLEGFDNSEAVVANFIDVANNLAPAFPGISAEDITISSVVAVETPDGYDNYDYVRATIQPKLGGRFLTGCEFTYGRTPVDMLAGITDSYWGGWLQYFHLPLSGLPVEPTTLHGMLPHFNAYYGMDIKTTDVVDKPLAVDNGVRYCKMEITQNSRIVGSTLGNRDVWVFFGEKNPLTQTNPLLQVLTHTLPASYCDINTISYTEANGFNITETPEERFLKALENDLGKPGGTFSGPNANFDIFFTGWDENGEFSSTILPRPNSIYSLPPDLDNEWAVISHKRFNLDDFHRRFLPYATETFQLDGGETAGLFVLDLSTIDPNKSRIGKREILEWFNTKYKANLRISYFDWDALGQWHSLGDGIISLSAGQYSSFYTGTLRVRLVNSNQ